MGVRQVVAAIAFLSIASSFVPTLAARSLAVYVVAPSDSTEAEASVIVQGSGWRRVGRGESASVLVVVRSGEVFPLEPTYHSMAALEEAAALQPNATGPRFHVYVFGVDATSALRQVKHLSYDVE